MGSAVETYRLGPPNEDAVGHIAFGIINAVVVALLCLVLAVCREHGMPGLKAPWGARSACGTATCVIYFHRLVLNGMRQDYSWNQSGGHYMNIYNHIRA